MIRAVPRAHPRVCIRVCVCLREERLREKGGNDGRTKQDTLCASGGRERERETGEKSENRSERVQGRLENVCFVFFFFFFFSVSFSPDGESSTCARACNPPRSSRGITQVWIQRSPCTRERRRSVETNRSVSFEEKNQSGGDCRARLRRQTQTHTHTYTTERSPRPTRHLGSRIERIVMVRMKKTFDFNTGD